MSEGCTEQICSPCQAGPFPVDFIDPNAGCETAQFSDEQPSLSDNTISWFSSSADFPAGDYKVEYIGGAMKYGVGEYWALNKSPVNGFYIYANNGSSVINGPGADFNTYADQTDLEDHNAGQFVQFHHSGGKIGVALVDSDYTTNVGGTQSPIFRLRKSCSYEQSPTPPDLTQRFLLDTTGYASFFTYPPDCETEGYFEKDLAHEGIAIWVLPDPFSRELVHFYNNPDFTEGDVLDFTAYMNVPPVSLIPGVERTLLVTIIGSDSGQNYEIPVAMVVISSTGTVTPSNNPDMTTDYNFIERRETSPPYDVLEVMDDLPSAIVEDYTTENVLFGLAEFLPELTDCAGTCPDHEPTIEGMMCAVQERQYNITTTEVVWPERTNPGTEDPPLPLTPTPAYPPEGFFDGDNSDADRAIQVQAISDAFNDDWVTNFATTGDWEGLNRIPVYYVGTAGDYGINRTTETQLPAIAVTDENWEESLETLQGYCCNFQWLAIDASTCTNRASRSVSPPEDAYDCGDSRDQAVTAWGGLSWTPAADSLSPLETYEDTQFGTGYYYSSIFVSVRGSFKFEVSQVSGGVGKVFWRLTPEPVSGTVTAHLDTAPIATLDSLLHVGAEAPPLAGSDFTTAIFGNPGAATFVLDCPNGSEFISHNGGWVTEVPVLQAYKSSNEMAGHWTYYP